VSQCPRCAGLLYLDAGQPFFLDKVCASCGQRWYFALPKNGHQPPDALREVLVGMTEPVKLMDIQRALSWRWTYGQLHEELEARGYEVFRPWVPRFTLPNGQVVCVPGALHARRLSE
jgi:hypothetical protein